MTTAATVAAVHREDIAYDFEGRRLVGTLAVDDTTDGPRPAVLVCHEGNGLTDHSRDVAVRLAELGFVAFALDYYGDGAPLPPEQIGERFNELAGDAALTRAIATAGLRQLLASPYADRSASRRSGSASAARCRSSSVGAARTSWRSSASTPACRPPVPRTPRTSRPRSSCASGPRTPSSRPSSAARSRTRCVPAVSTGG